MTKKERINYFFKKFKRTIIASSLCVLAVAIIGFVAAKSSQESNIDGFDKNVQTSSPTAIIFSMPVENGTIIKDFSNTALKYNSTLKQWEAHKAIDIKGSDDANVLACYDGEVVSIESTYLKGTIITIKHNKSLQTVYASLDPNVNVKVGDKVKQGDVIGKVSTSAKGEMNDGNHLHFEVLLNGVKTDPNLYLNNSNNK